MRCFANRQTHTINWHLLHNIIPCLSWWQVKNVRKDASVCFSSQSVSTSDAAAEAAVLSHSHSEPREAAAAGPPPAPALQLRSQLLQQHCSGPLPETRPLCFPPGSHGNTLNQSSGSGEMMFFDWSMSTFMYLGVFCFVYDGQEAPPHPSLHPVHEALPHPLFHQLQRDGAQVGCRFSSHRWHVYRTRCCVPLSEWASYLPDCTC